ncbi:MAG TPA: acyltransferase [Kofleriaceae bacterium]|nr:acyltransferase [Kofleriaceae bacterium]
MNRRPELDWLRVVAIAILHVFHVGMIFNRWDFHLKNPEPLPVLEPPMAFLHQVRMPLLMVIAGIATAIALERRSIAGFAIDRIKRLLVPLVFGMFVIVPPQIFIERIASGRFTGSYFAFYPSVLELRPYPAGSFSWHHLWFVAYLFVYCMLAIPLFVALDRAPGRRLLGWLDRAWARGGIVLLFVPLALERFALRGYPETHDLTHDPDTLAYYGLLFVLGHLIGRSRTVWDHLVARRRRYLAATCVLLAVMLPPNEYPAPLEQLGALATIWCLILTALGWTRWYFQRPAARVPGWLDHAQRLSYPFYILHQTVILVIGWAWLAVPLGPWPRFGAVLITSFAATWLGCELVARVPALRPWFGLAPHRRSSLRLARVG